MYRMNPFVRMKKNNEENKFATIDIYVYMFCYIFVRSKMFPERLNDHRSNKNSLLPEIPYCLQYLIA